MKNKSSLREVSTYIIHRSQRMLKNDPFAFVFAVAWYGVTIPALIIASTALVLDAVATAFVGSTLVGIGGILEIIAFILSLLFILFIKVENLKEEAHDYLKNN